MTDPYASIPLPGLTRLLSAGRPTTGTPIEAIRQRLNAADGQEWVAAVLHKSPNGVAGEAYACLLEASITAHQRSAIHQAAKQLVATASENAEVDRGRLWYVLAIAAGILRDKRILTSQPAETITAALLDLAPDMPEPWNELLAQAAIEVDRCD